MNIKPNDSEQNLDEQKPMKVQLSKRHHIILHSLKILTGETISEITGAALERYYKEAEGDVEEHIEDI